MSQIILTRTTGNAQGAENRLVRNIGPTIGMLEPDIAPLITLMSKMKNKRRAIDSPVHEFMEEDYAARWGQDAGSGATTSQTALTVIDGTIFVAGDLFQVPRPTTENLSIEIIRVDSVSTNTLTVTRGFAGTTKRTIAANAAFRLIGSAYAEGADLPGQKLTAPVTYTTYLQIFRKTIDFTKTAIASRLHGAPNGERKREHKKKMIEFKEQLNSALLWGKASQDLTGSAPIRTTMGINSRIATNITDAGGYITRTAFETFSQSAFRYGSKTKLLLAPPQLISAVNQWATSFLNVTPGTKEFGLQISNILMGHGTWMMVRDWMLESPPAGSNGLNSIAFSLDLNEIETLYLSGNGENRDVKLTLDKLQNGSDRRVDEILGEIGFRVGQEKYHAKLWNIQGYVA